VAFRYVRRDGSAVEGDTPNGSMHDIAGIVSERRNVLGMMPHPERACEPLLGSSDGMQLFRSVATSVSGNGVMPVAAGVVTSVELAVASDAELAEVALTRAEYIHLVESLGREPNRLELGIVGALWSEHCSYKTSKPLLGTLPTKGPRVLQGPARTPEPSTSVTGLPAFFKIESHNHPSAIEPYQGAATGVGGILRDIFTMGARPIALLDSLRFGPLDEPHQRHLFDGVVAGIGGYGNCIGVPTVGGELYFDESYRTNCLVNAMCVRSGGARQADPGDRERPRQPRPPRRRRHRA